INLKTARHYGSSRIARPSQRGDRIRELVVQFLHQTDMRGLWRDAVLRAKRMPAGRAWKSPFDPEADIGRHKGLRAKEVSALFARWLIQSRCAIPSPHLPRRAEFAAP